MWDKIKAWFKRSETIFLARAQVAIGAVTALMAQFSDILNSMPEFKAFLIANKGWLIGLSVLGIVTELLRRRNDPNLGK